MSKIESLFKNEKLLEKVATAETREDAKKACKEEGLELTDTDLDAVAGGLNTTQKILIGVGAAAGTAAVGVGTYYTGKHFGWWNGPLTRKELEGAVGRAVGAAGAAERAKRGAAEAAEAARGSAEAARGSESRTAKMTFGEYGCLLSDNNYF